MLHASVPVGRPARMCGDVRHTTGRIGRGAQSGVTLPMRGVRRNGFRSRWAVVRRAVDAPRDRATQRRYSLRGATRAAMCRSEGKSNGRNCYHRRRRPVDVSRAERSRLHSTRASRECLSRRRVLLLLHFALVYGQHARA